MKKLLITTTALVVCGAGAAYADGLEAEVGGYVNIGTAYTDTVTDFEGGIGGESDAGPFHLVRDGEIWLGAGGTLDNGISLRYRVELEAFGGGEGDTVDENYAVVSGAFGELMIGGNDDAKVSVGYAGNVCNNAFALFCYYDSALPLVAPDGPAGYNDSLGIHYTTPTVAGFTAGASYQPDASSDGDDFDGQSSGPDNGDDRTAFGANYRGDFGAVSFGVGAGYLFQDETADTIGSTDEAYQIGADIGFGGFTIGVLYDHEDKHGAPTEEDWTGGVAYTTGPWSMNVGYAFIENGGRTFEDAEQAAGGITYALGPGVNVTAAIEYADTDEPGVDGEFGGVTYMNLQF